MLMLIDKQNGGNMSDANEHLNDLCQMTSKPDVLNALHACRDGYPLGRRNNFKWRNAYVLVRQNTVDFARADLSWLKAQAEVEAKSEGNGGL